MFVVTIKDFKIIPYVRMTRKGKFVKKRALQYVQNQNQLAWLIKVHGKGSIESFPVILKGIVVLKNLRKNADLDNYLKAVQDALVKAGILPDDCLKYIGKVEFIVKQGKKDVLTCFLKEMKTSQVFNHYDHDHQNMCMPSPHCKCEE